MEKHIHKVKFFIKNIIAYSLFYSGALFIIKKYVCKNKYCILTYHRILPDSEKSTSFSNDGIIVRPETFEKHLKFLSKHFNPLSVDDFYNTISCTKIKAHKHTPCLITFDDGWVDNYIYAAPLLKKLSLPATIFLPTMFINKNNLFWQEKIARAISNLLTTTGDEANEIINKYNLKNLANSKIEIQRLNILKYVNGIKSWPYSEIDELYNTITDLIGESFLNSHIDKYMDWNQINELSNSKISFGSHAHTHKVLTRLNTNEINHEIKSSIQLISNSLNKTVKYIAYPNGDSDQKVQDIAKSSGHLLGFGTIPGLVTNNDNLYDLKRINMHENKAPNVPLLFMTILGLY